MPAELPGDNVYVTSVTQNGDARIHIKRISVHTRSLFFVVGIAELKFDDRL
jgi:hypothetical protein